MAKKTPTHRTIQLMEGEGYRAGIVERRVTTFLTIDLFGCIDVLAVRGGETVAIQVTSGSNVSARVKKITDECADALADMRAAGWAVLVHGWRKNSKGVWVCRTVDLS